MSSVYSKMERVVAHTNSLDGSWHVVQVVSDYFFLGVKVFSLKKEEVRSGCYPDGD
ncbi:MAG: hypothetical protein Q8862_10630 [Bacteroidota bacterium]|nr:hypothetical protein [Bacteroidota bacterium]